MTEPLNAAAERLEQVAEHIGRDLPTDVLCAVYRDVPGDKGQALAEDIRAVLASRALPASEGGWVTVPKNKRFGRRISADAVEHLAPGTLLRFYSEDPWFEPGEHMPTNGEIVEFTGAVNNDFPLVGPHLEVRTLDGHTYPGGGWVHGLFQFVGDPISAAPSSGGRVEALESMLRECLPRCREDTPHRCARLGGDHPGAANLCCRAHVILGGGGGKGASQGTQLTHASSEAATDEPCDLEEAIRLAEIGEYLFDAKSFAAGDGYHEPRELSINWEWQQAKPNEYGEGQLLAEATAWHEGMREDGVETEAAKLRRVLAALSSEAVSQKSEPQASASALATDEPNSSPSPTPTDSQDGGA